MIAQRRDLLNLLFVPLCFISCTNKLAWNNVLPTARELLTSSATELQISANSRDNRAPDSPSSPDLPKNSRGYFLTRAALHMHSPYSYDACTSISKDQCYADLRSSFCKNHLDFVALTDHPSHMTELEFPKLLLNEPEDELIFQDGQNSNPIANRMTCSDGHKVLIMAGFESQMMALGMTQHIEPTPERRAEEYSKRSSGLSLRLKNEADAIVVMPHTEGKGKTPEKLSNLSLDAIEIYNLHANISPKIRADELGLTYFSGLIDLLVYWVDPFGEQQADLAFLSFMTVRDVYAHKWDALISQGQHLTGIGGNDAHQSLFPGKAKDGDKIDSYRRLSRWVANDLLVKDLTVSEFKNALRKGRSWVTFEGLGSPVDFDFFVETPSQTLELGDTVYLSDQTTILHAQMPTLHHSSPQSGVSPKITLKLIYVDVQGNESVIESTDNSAIRHEIKSPGAYRVEVDIIPRHLKRFVGYQKQITERAFKWIISNHIYVSSGPAPSSL